MSRQAIVTKFLPPTNTLGARVKVTAQAGRMTVPWDYALGMEENHRDAALAFAAKQGWRTEGAVLGTLPSGGYVLVLSSR
jgi:hypothetical protein